MQKIFFFIIETEEIYIKLSLGIKNNEIFFVEVINILYITNEGKKVSFIKHYSGKFTVFALIASCYSNNISFFLLFLQLRSVFYSHFFFMNLKYIVTYFFSPFGGKSNFGIEVFIHVFLMCLNDFNLFYTYLVKILDN